jgi:hypothetical protein
MVRRGGAAIGGGAEERQPQRDEPSGDETDGARLRATGGKGDAHTNTRVDRNRATRD